MRFASTKGHKVAGSLKPSRTKTLLWVSTNIVLSIVIVALFASCNSSPTGDSAPKNLSISASLSGDSYSATADWLINIDFTNSGNTDLKITAATISAYGSLGLAINDFTVGSTDILLNVAIPAGTTKHYSISGTSTTYVIYSFATSWSVTSTDGSLSKDFSFSKASLTVH